MQRYIDADALLERLKRTPRYFDVKHDIEQMPTADVVPRSNEGAECPICHGTGRIGTTDWLTKHISANQLAKKKAEAVAEYDRHLKAKVAREIFEEIEERIATHAFTSKSEDYADGMFDAIEWVDPKIDELKKTYTEGNDVS